MDPDPNTPINRPKCEFCDNPATVLAGQVGPTWVPACDGHFESLDLWWDGETPQVPSYQLVRIY